MTDTLPEPPVPADADLRGYGFMPLYGHQLLDSEFSARASDTGWRAGLTLWWAAWNQVPAGSLPDDDILLCRLADLGRDMRTWRRIKSEALHGFRKHADGRLYSVFLAKLANEAWDRRVTERARKASWRAKRTGTDGAVDADEGGHSTPTATVPSPSPRRARPGRQERTGEDRRGDSKNPVPSEPTGTAPPPPSPPAGPVDSTGPELPLAEPPPDDMPDLQLWMLKPPNGDWKILLFRQALDWLKDHGKLADKAARGVIGTWLRTAQQDHREVFERIADAEKLGIAEPVAWITKSLAVRHGSSGQQAAVADMDALRAKAERLAESRT